MKAPPSLAAAVLDHSWFRDPIKRRMSFALILALLGVLVFFPRHYLAEAELLWEDTSGNGLSGILGRGAGGGISLGALIGSHESIEADLTIARSESVVVSVVRQLHLVGSHGFSNQNQAELGVRKRVSIAAMRGSILQVKAIDSDPSFARRLTAAYVKAIDERLKALAVGSARDKMRVTNQQMADTVANLSKAQENITKFRLLYHLAAPEVELTAAVGHLSTLQAQIDAKNTELSTLKKFESPNNIQYQTVVAEIQALNERVESAKLQSPATPSVVPGLPYMATRLSEYTMLYRNELYYQNLYQIYVSYLESVKVDEMSANANMDVVEPPYVHPGRQLNSLYLGLFLIIAMIAAGSEFYVLMPPVGRRRS